MADKIVVMHDGVVEQVGAPLELYDRPDNIFVAGFIGSPSMNFLKGKISGDTFRTDSGLTLPLPTRGARPADGMPAVYGLRPEHVRLAEGGVPVEVAVVEPTGSETMVLVRPPGGGTQAIANEVARDIACVFRDRIGAGPGERIGITADPALVHLFDAENGRRLGAFPG